MNLEVRTKDGERKQKKLRMRTNGKEIPNETIKPVRMIKKNKMTSLMDHSLMGKDKLTVKKTTFSSIKRKERPWTQFSSITVNSISAVSIVSWCCSFGISFKDYSKASSTRKHINYLQLPSSTYLFRYIQTISTTYRIYLHHLRPFAFVVQKITLSFRNN